MYWKASNIQLNTVTSYQLIYLEGKIHSLQFSNLLLSEILDALGKAVEGDDINPKEYTYRDQLVEGGPKEEVKQVN